MRGLYASAVTTSMPRASRRMPEIRVSLSGRNANAAIATRTADRPAEMKKPLLMAVMPERSPVRGVTAKMPTTAVTTPIAGTTSGNTRPREPNAVVPRMRAATRVTA